MSLLLIFGGLVIALELLRWVCLLPCEGHVFYAEVGHQFSTRSRDVLMNAQCPHKWWSTLESATFCSTSSLTPLNGFTVVGELVCELVWHIYYQIILIVSSPQILYICHPLAINLSVLQHLPLVRVRLDNSCWSLSSMVALTLWVCFLFYFQEDGWHFG